MGKRVKKQAKKAIILVMAVFFLVVGVAGLVLPVLNGIVFLVISLVLFSVYSVAAKDLLHKVGKQHPKMDKVVSSVEAWVARQVGDTTND